LTRLLHRPRVRATLAWAIGAYLKVVMHTVRWRHEDLQGADAAMRGAGGVIAAFWHGRIPLGLALLTPWRPAERKQLRALISPSRDGEIIAQALAMSGLGAIRMSSARGGQWLPKAGATADRLSSRAAMAALRTSVDWVREGGGLIVTPDGPLGPNEAIAPGLLQIARRTAAPVFLVGVAAAPAWRLKTWDRMMLACPFGRGVVVWDGPHTAPAGASDAENARVVEDWTRRLTAATRRAEALVAGETPEAANPVARMDVAT